MKRIPVEALLAPSSIYKNAARMGKGYRPTPASRFAVLRETPELAWRLIHLRSGSGVDSLLPALPRQLTMTDKLAVAAAFEASTHLEWEAFDALPQIELGGKGRGFEVLPERLQQSARATAAELRRIAARALNLESKAA